jgi:uncharacterized protein YdeI (YjbR/CyaY-like superfamily)
MALPADSAQWISGRNRVNRDCQLYSVTLSWRCAHWQWLRISFMPTDSRVDHYIEKAPDFAKPILKQLRELVHKACPEVSEDLKWSRPAFLQGGKILCGMVAFKAHCSFYIFPSDITKRLREEGQFEALSEKLAKMTQLKDLPPGKEVLRYLREAVHLIDESLSDPAPRKRDAQPKPEASVPEDLGLALARNKKAAQAFESFSNSHRREYIEWITEAKREETRQKRVATALEWLAEGKPRNWKYMNC